LQGQPMRRRRDGGSRNFLRHVELEEQSRIPRASTTASVVLALSENAKGSTEIALGTLE